MRVLMRDWNLIDLKVSARFQFLIFFELSLMFGSGSQFFFFHSDSSFGSRYKRFKGFVIRFYNRAH